MLELYHKHNGPISPMWERRIEIEPQTPSTTYAVCYSGSLVWGERGFESSSWSLPHEGRLILAIRPVLTRVFSMDVLKDEAVLQRIFFFF